MTCGPFPSPSGSVPNKSQSHPLIDQSRALNPSCTAIRVCFMKFRGHGSRFSCLGGKNKKTTNFILGNHLPTIGPTNPSWSSACRPPVPPSSYCAPTWILHATPKSFPTGTSSCDPVSPWPTPRPVPQQHHPYRHPLPAASPWTMSALIHPGRSAQTTPRCPWALVTTHGASDAS